MTTPSASLPTSRSCTASASPLQPMFSCRVTGSWYRSSRAGSLCTTAIRRPLSPTFSGPNPGITGRPRSASTTHPTTAASLSCPSSRHANAVGRELTSGQGVPVKGAPGEEIPVPVGRGRHALVGLPVQLRRPAGHLLGVPTARGGDGPLRRPTRGGRRSVHVGVRGRPAVRRRRRRSGEPEGPDPRRAAVLVGRHPGDRVGHGVLASGPVPGAGGAGRGVLLPGVDVAPERLPRQGDPVPGDGTAPVERLRRHGTRRGRGRILRRLLRLAVGVLPVRRARYRTRRRPRVLPPGADPR